jgi:predicted nicotinamide N-methyase
MDHDLVDQVIDLPSGTLTLLQPRAAAEIPDVQAVEWAPVAPYWSILWRSGVALAREIERMDLRGRRVIELGCGLAVPSFAAARAGAEVLATDGSDEALELVERNIEKTGLPVETARLEWGEPDKLMKKRAPFDVVLAADVLYERHSVALLLGLVPRLAPQFWLADPDRPAADAFLEQVRKRATVETRKRGLVRIHRIRFD